VNRYLILLVVFLQVSVSHAQTTADSSIEFVESSIKQLQKKTNTGGVPLSLKKYYKWFTKDMKDCHNQEYYNDFMQTITDESIEKGIYHQVEIVTPTPGAQVKYQTVLERVKKITPKETNNPTNNCINQWPLGYYYVWAERKGKPTTDINKRVWISGQQKLILQE
jgi:hypothetical protein